VDELYNDNLWPAPYISLALPELGRVLKRQQLCAYISIDAARHRCMRMQVRLGVGSLL
jgi:hypothetical protein